MSPITSSGIAIVVGWAVSIASLGVMMLITRGNLADLGVTSIWIALFVGIGWGMFVAPLASRFARIRFLSDVRFAWLGWCIYACVIYLLLLSPIFRNDVLDGIWIAAVLGAAHGLCFALLVRRSLADHGDASLNRG